MQLLDKCRFGIGPMSKNVVDICTDYANEKGVNFIFIPSRRQIDFNCGYVNNWNVKTFAQYVRQRTSKALLERDHGGPYQGVCEDDGLESLQEDCKYFDIIHVDVWNKVRNFDEGCWLTAAYIKYCFNLNPNIYYEIGTEESIFKYSATDLDTLIVFCKTILTLAQFSRVKFVVVQSGSWLKENQNIGCCDYQRLFDMVAVCKKHGLFSKEHNGDYLPMGAIKNKFKCDLNCINIAPQFGLMETQTYLDQIKNKKMFDQFFEICYTSKKWVKWVDVNFKPEKNKEKLVRICGHYVFSHEDFIKEVRQKIDVDIDRIIKKNLFKLLDQIFNEAIIL